MALGHKNFTIALYLAQAASDDYECLREDFHGVDVVLYGLPWWLWPSSWPRMTLLSTLIWSLELVNRGGHSRLELDSVPGVDWKELFDMNGFSELHKIVYGVSGRLLDAEIDARPEDLDRPDNLGLTPL